MGPPSVVIRGGRQAPQEDGKRGTFSLPQGQRDCASHRRLVVLLRSPSVRKGNCAAQHNNCATHVMSVITSHHITSHHITSRHVTSRHITSHHITSHHITSHHITSHHITLHYITLHYITSHHITLTLRYVYITLCHANF